LQGVALAASFLMEGMGFSPCQIAMTATEILTTLKKAGKPQTAAIYKRHGVGDNVFGTLTSEIGKLQKKIKVDHALALQLWKTGNAEARMLAVQVADPAQVTRALAETFVSEGPVRFLWTYLAALIGRSPIADKTMRDWMKSADEETREMGYNILCARLKDDPDAISDADAAKVLATIEKQIHTSPNWARYAMNNAVIAIGVWKPHLRRDAIAAATRIGDIDVDHGETNCKTPEAASYIQKAAKRGK
jgi:3-methyladenine DNA glycosylase AlkD